MIGHPLIQSQIHHAVSVNGLEVEDRNSFFDFSINFSFLFPNLLSFVLILNAQVFKFYCRNLFCHHSTHWSQWAKFNNLDLETQNVQVYKIHLFLKRCLLNLDFIKKRYFSKKCINQPLYTKPCFEKTEDHAQHCFKDELTYTQSPFIRTSLIRTSTEFLGKFKTQAFGGSNLRTTSKNLRTTTSQIFKAVIHFKIFHQYFYW